MAARYYLGVDPGLAHAAAAVVLSRGDGTVELYRAGVVETEAGTPLPRRLHELASKLRAFVSAVDAEVELDARWVAVEDFARGARFRREEMGMALACALVALTGALGDPQVRLIPPREVKAAVAPGWPGFSKAAWAAAGRRGKFKRSMPDKTTVASCLSRRFGVHILGEHEVDAACVAIAAAIRDGRVGSTVEPTAQDEGDE